MRNVAQIRNQIPMEPNPIQKAMENYQEMEQERDEAKAELTHLRIENGSLVGEVNMLREEMARCDKDRARLQAVANTLLGRLFAINDVIGGAVRASIKDGIEADQPAPADERMEKAASEVAEVLQRVQPTSLGETLDAPPTSPQAPQVAGAATPVKVDWGKLPQG